MKSLKYTFIGLVFFFSACEENLEKPLLGSLTAGTFPQSESDAILAVNGVYNSLRVWNIHTGGFPLLDIMSDQMIKGSNPGDGTAIAPYDNFSHTATEGSGDRWYKTLYQAIRRANLVINEVPNAEIVMDEELRVRIVAEARFLRGYFYSQLVQGFGAVPLVLVTDPALDLTKTSAEEIFNQVIYPDLLHAAEFLPEKSEYSADEAGRATKGAAKALLARLYLFNGDFVNAEKYALEVIASAQYELEPNFADAFSYDHEFGVESIFEIGALPFPFDQGGNQYGNTMGIRGTPNRGWGFGRPAYPWILMMQANNDPRMDASIIFLGEVLDGVETGGDASTPDTTRVDGDIVEIEVYNQKIWHPGPGTNESFGHNKRIIRYADVLLMAAEALNENNKPAEALVYLNEVRERARGGNAGILPDITVTDQAALRLAIENERNYELAFEGLRFWDLVRTNRAETVLGPLGFVKDKNELFPIPQSEVDISEGRISQNKGY
ncbi:RagB/SusD family nutrient uptake outer membrane protein [Marinoscillum sp. 108]|uniref:RagB/SusD family nutrient uptake outer membrane protein n=1 Tax=Marinoscillum sp. 108 TaxID=2653151 RepID=UPI0012F2C0D2|nr:RagB/SusD family nutrient uptake outer membrane protein [Marinoscillum sp. 108]VXD12288.1 Starch-binding associating with outer membrane [Marinoscillum sp. 108]